MVLLDIWDDPDSVEGRQGERGGRPGAMPEDVLLTGFGPLRSVHRLFKLLPMSLKDTVPTPAPLGHHGTLHIPTNVDNL